MRIKNIARQFIGRWKIRLDIDEKKQDTIIQGSFSMIVSKNDKIELKVITNKILRLVGKTRVMVLLTFL